MSTTKTLPTKTFVIFGESIEILIPSELTAGRSTTLVQTSPPGGGPPPHSHRDEDETFRILEGDYEFLSNGEWRKVAPGETFHSQRGSVHTFRNVGTTTGRVLIFVTPAGIEEYFAEIAPLSVPADMPQILAISERFGISFA